MENNANLLCSQCNHPLQPNSRFCPYCGTSCSQSLPNKSTSICNHKARLIVLYVLYGIGLFAAVLWRPIYNWYVDLFKEYGNHLFWFPIVLIEDSVRAALIAICSSFAFFFDAKQKKKIASLFPVGMYLGLLVMRFVVLAYYSHKFGVFRDDGVLSGLIQFPTLSPGCFIDLIYPILLLLFILTNEKLKKKSIAFVIPNIFCYFMLSNISLPFALASIIGFTKHIWQIRCVSK